MCGAKKEILKKEILKKEILKKEILKKEILKKEIFIRWPSLTGFLAMRSGRLT